jgi:hypothetical protein
MGCQNAAGSEAGTAALSTRLLARTLPGFGFFVQALLEAVASMLTRMTLP